jgi:ABC-2 type transport system permease protein
MQTSIMILFPLVFTTNIWVSESTMPGWLQAVVKVNPVTRVVIAVRDLMGGSVVAADIGWALLSCGVIVALFAPITMYLYNKKLRA